MIIPIIPTQRKIVPNVNNKYRIGEFEMMIGASAEDIRLKDNIYIK